MRLGIMQPYFFPYLGHFSLIAHTDFWVVFDITQYTPKTWMNRNRILHPKEGWNYVSVPLANSSISIKTSEARILDPAASRKTILGKLSHYKRKAPHYEAVEALVEEAFSEPRDDSLVGLNVRGLSAVCRYLDIPFNFAVCSEMSLALPLNLEAGEWAPEICRLLGAREYINPAGGRGLFSKKDFADNGTVLRFIETDALFYDTGPYRFEPHLSILDVLMWNDPKIIREALAQVSRLTDA